MKVQITTLKDNKLLREFADDKAFLGYVEHNNSKIKNIEVLDEATLPELEKGAEVAKPSMSKGWGVLPKSAFGKITSPEKGESMGMSEDKPIATEFRYEPTKPNDKAVKDDANDKVYLDGAKTSQPKVEQKPAEKEVKPEPQKEASKEDKDTTVDTKKPAEPKEEKKEEPAEKEEKKEDKEEVKESVEEPKEEKKSRGGLRIETYDVNGEKLYVVYLNGGVVTETYDKEKAEHFVNSFNKAIEDMKEGEKVSVSEDKDSRLKYLKDKEEVAGLDKEERYELLYGNDDTLNNAYEEAYEIWNNAGSNEEDLAKVCSDVADKYGVDADKLVDMINQAENPDEENVDEAVNEVLKSAGVQVDEAMKSYNHEYDDLIGKTIRIINMVEEPKYTNKEGVVERIDDIGQLHGTWGGLAVQPDRDTFEVIDNEGK